MPNTKPAKSEHMNQTTKMQDKAAELPDKLAKSEYMNQTKVDKERQVVQRRFPSGTCAVKVEKSSTGKIF